MANTDWYLYNFRRDLVRRLQVAGCTVVLACPPGPYVSRLVDLGVEYAELPFGGASKSVVSNWFLASRCWRILRSSDADLVHLFTIKCVLFGGAVSRILGIPRIASVTGLGHLYVDGGISSRLLRWIIYPLHRFALRGNRIRVIFQNDGDKDVVLGAGLVDSACCRLIRGSGVDLQRFKPAPRESQRSSTRVLFASRLLVEKGIRELISAFNAVIRDGRPLELWIAGTTYPGNPSTLEEAEVEILGSMKGIRLLGHVEDMPAVLSDVDIVVLPSYSEGTPRILIEAAAMGLPLIASDIPGCRGLVIDGYNGFLVSPRSVDALEVALRSMLMLTVAELREMGARSRVIAARGFGEATVNAATIELYADLLSSSVTKS